MNKKTKGLLILLFSYIISFIIGLISFKFFENNIPIIWNILIANVVSTIVIYIIGCIYKTASIYDPYWSIQTVVIYICLMIYYKTINVGNVIFLICILFWAIRLTYNFIHGFNDISYIDWRYKMLKEKTNKLYPIVNLLGIHLVPTLIVYFASIPSFLYVINNNNFKLINVVGLLIMILATLLELISDYNMIQFKKVRKDKNEIINIGLWKYSRHPNYLGEILFWYGVSLTFILSNVSLWYVIIGAILNTLLFVFISIPMAENHLSSYKENYSDYKQKTRMLLPLKK
ncbi:MAG: DUF1295 domain-containing protein [Bacilli bacterium]|nr:DUF1295 domain-containing protein [Bacilli bacterium]